MSSAAVSPAEFHKSGGRGRRRARQSAAAPQPRRRRALVRFQRRSRPSAFRLRRVARPLAPVVAVVVGTVRRRVNNPFVVMFERLLGRRLLPLRTPFVLHLKILPPHSTDLFRFNRKWRFSCCSGTQPTTSLIMTVVNFDVLRRHRCRSNVKRGYVI